MAGCCCLRNRVKAATHPTHGQAFLVAGGNCAVGMHPSGVCRAKFLLPRDFRVITIKLTHMFDCIKGNELLSGPVF